MKTMKAVVLRETNQENHFEDGLLSVPELQNPKDVLIEVKAVSVNPIDTKTAKQKIDNDYRILGWDGAGIVKETGAEVTSFKIGDEVFYAGDFSRAGSNSQYQLVDERLIAKKPKNLSFEESGAIPLTGLTAWESLYDRLGISEADKGKQILIINGAGGVGSIAIQLAKKAGLQVITTASREETMTWVQKMGADFVINHRNALSDELEKIGIREVPYILCLYNTSMYWQEIAKIIQPQGKICSIVDGGSPVDLDLLKNKSVTFSWEFMFTRSLYQTADMSRQGEILKQLAELYDSHELESTVTESIQPINAENLEKAHQLVGRGKMVGKLVLSGW
ncbi:zinc-binding alcohol dehydrogenase family protein [Enterococcus sp. LJL128]